MGLTCHSKTTGMILTVIATMSGHKCGQIFPLGFFSFSKEQTAGTGMPAENLGACDSCSHPKRVTVAQMWVEAEWECDQLLYLESRAKRIRCFPRQRVCVSKGQESRRALGFWHEQQGE